MAIIQLFNNSKIPQSIVLHNNTSRYTSWCKKQIYLILVCLFIITKYLMGNICKESQKNLQFQHIIPPNKNKLIRKSSRHSNSDFAIIINEFPSLSTECQCMKERLPDFFQTYTVHNIDFRDKVPEDDDNVYKLSNGTIYQGQWHKEEIHGKGRFYLTDASYLQCYSVENRPTAKVRLIKQNGDYFEGFTKQGEADGPGIYFNKMEKSKYEGNFTNNLLSGQVTETGQGYYFRGTYVKGQKKQGRLVWWNEFVEGHSEPTGEDAKKCEYIGEFSDEKFHGQGILRNTIGEYEGKFQKGIKKGLGKFTWKDGSRFQGKYSKNQKNGEGKIYNPQGQLVLQGKWTHNKPPIIPQGTLNEKIE